MTLRNIRFRSSATAHQCDLHPVARAPLCLPKRRRSVSFSARHGKRCKRRELPSGAVSPPVKTHLGAVARVRKRPRSNIGHDLAAVKISVATYRPPCRTVAINLPPGDLWRRLEKLRRPQIAKLPASAGEKFRRIASRFCQSYGVWLPEVHDGSSQDPFRCIAVHRNWGVVGGLPTAPRERRSTINSVACALARWKQAAMAFFNRLLAAERAAFDAASEFRASAAVPPATSGRFRRRRG